MLPEQEPGLLPDGFVQVVVAAGLSSRSTPVFAHRVFEPPTVHVSVFLAEAVLPNVGASTTARIAATPIARNIVLLFIITHRSVY
jgi:hypothetical protein